MITGIYVKIYRKAILWGVNEERLAIVIKTGRQVYGVFSVHVFESEIAYQNNFKKEFQMKVYNKALCMMKK